MSRVMKMEEKPQKSYMVKLKYKSTTAEVLHVNVLCYCFSVVAGHLCYGGYICYTLSVIEFPDVVDLIHCQHSPSSFSFIL